MTLETLAAPASRIARRTPDGEWQADGRGIALVILEPDVFETFGACVTRGWTEIPGCGNGSADVTGPVGLAIADACRAHGPWHTAWIADTHGRVLARSVYPWNGAGVRVSG